MRAPARVDQQLELRAGRGLSDAEPSGDRARGHAAGTRSRHGGTSQWLRGNPQGRTQKSAKRTTAIKKSPRDHGRGTRRDAGARPRAEGGHAPRPRARARRTGKRRAREDRRDAESGSRHGRAAPRDRQSQRADPLAENLVRNARVRQRRQGRLLLPKARRSSRRGTRRSASATRRTSTKAPCGRPPSLGRN
jgi:hypothetical protein